jgi:hypothetical protein
MPVKPGRLSGFFFEDTAESLRGAEAGLFRDVGDG